jgi:hypothetical protein
MDEEINSFNRTRNEWYNANVRLEDRLKLLANRRKIILNDYLRTRFSPRAMARLRKKDPLEAFTYSVAVSTLGEVEQIVKSSRDKTLKKIYAECQQILGSLESASKVSNARLALEQTRADASYIPEPREYERIK